MRFLVAIHLRTGTGLNAREHWAVRAKRVRKERRVTSLTWKAIAPRKIALPVDVLLIRQKPRGKLLDGDNLQGSLKAIRDQVAAELGIDDGSALVTWAYGQRTGPWAVYVDVTDSVCPPDDTSERAISDSSSRAIECKRR